MAETTISKATPVLLTNRRRFTTVAILFIFMALHQADKMVISSLTTPIMDFFHINEAQMGLALTGAIIVGAVFYPLWGYLFDRYVRPRILALAALIWSATTWLGAIAPNFGLFVATRASTGIDDASYPGIYSLVSDYFGPTRRGRIIGLLQLSTIIGPLLGVGMATALRDTIGWRNVFIITGSLGVVVALLILVGIKDVPRGSSEPEVAGLTQFEASRFSWRVVRTLLRKPTFLVLFIQQFIFVFPFNAISFWYYRYLEVERGLGPAQVMMTVGVMGVIGALGNFLFGMLGDMAFKRHPRGRMFVALSGLVLLIVFFTSALRVPAENFTLFFTLQTIGALFISVVYPNVTATLQDIVEPEVRSSAHAVLGIADTGGSALAPLVTGMIAVGASLQTAMLRITTIGWVVGWVLLVVVTILLPRDLRALRRVMQERAASQQSKN